MKIFTFLLFALLCLALVDAKKKSKSKAAKPQKEVIKQTDDAKDDESSGEDDEADMMNRSFKETSLPGTAVAQSSLPAATKASDAKQTKSAVESDVESSGEDDDEISGSETTDTKVDENANKPSKVQSKIHVEKDKNKIAETVKKSKVTKKGANRAGKKTTAADQSKQEAEKEGKKATKTEMSKKVDEKKSKKTADKKSKKPSKPARHHHHHHHHHHKQNAKKSNAKRPTVDNEANKPKIDYPTFNWTKDGNKVQKVAQIPGWGGNGINNMAPAGMAQANMVQMSIAQAYGQMPAVKRDDVPMKLSTDLLNGTIKNQADIASIDQASTETGSISSPKNQMAAAQPINAAPASNSTTSSNAEAIDSAKDPVSATIASDTGEVPSNIRKKAELKIPKTVPSRCTNLVKSYTNAELTLRDYLKQMRKCKRADAEFNSLHGNAMLRDAISKNGPYLTKEAYKYALERVRNYVPSSKEKEAADMILAKWRSNSFGTRDKINKNGDVPDAIKSFMTGQTAKEAAAQNIEEQTQKAIDTAKSYILGTITGRPAEVPAKTPIANEGSDTEKKATIVNVINAAKALLTGDSKGHAILLSHGSDVPAVLPLPGTKKEDIASPVEKKAKALEMAKTADALNAAMMSQLSPNIVTNSEKVSSNLVAALRDMASGPETAQQQGLKPSLQKRSARMTLKANSRRKRSASNEASITYNKLFKIKRRRRQMREKPLKIDNPSERSKLNKPIVAAPKLMDKIRDMSMVIATP